MTKAPDRIWAHIEPSDDGDYIEFLSEEPWSDENPGTEYILSTPTALAAAGYVPVDSVVMVKPLDHIATAARVILDALGHRYEPKNKLWTAIIDAVVAKGNTTKVRGSDGIIIALKTLSAITTQPADPDAYAQGYNAALGKAALVVDCNCNEMCMFEECSKPNVERILDLMIKPTQETDEC